MKHKRRSASCSDGTVLQRKKVLSRQRSYSVPSLGYGGISPRILQSRLHTATDIGGTIAHRILTHGGKDGVHVTMSDWLNNPMLVNDAQLADILSIEQSTEASPTLHTGSVTCFRSWLMVADELCQVVEELRKHGYGNRVEAWTLVLKGCLPATPITVRYVGSTSAPRNPFKRVQKNTERPQSLLGTFLSTIDRLFPSVSRSHRVYAINGSFIADFNKESAKQNVLFQRFYNSATDHAERCMVAFFGTQTLLNRQRGGKHRMLTPDYEEERVLMRCNTSLLSKANNCFTPPPEKVISDVGFLFESWWEYARKEIWLEEDRAKEIDRKTYLSGTYSQAVAKSLAHGSFLLALCGHEPPISSVNDGADILSGVRATSSFVRSVLTSMAAVETGICNTPITALADLISFNQLLNWPHLNSNQKGESRVCVMHFYRLLKSFLTCT